MNLRFASWINQPPEPFMAISAFVPLGRMNWTFVDLKASKPGITYVLRTSQSSQPPPSHC